MIRRYVIEVYEKPMAQQEGLEHEAWLKKLARERSGKQSGLKVVQTTEGLRQRLKQEFEYKQDNCAACGSKMEIIYAYSAHVALLESIIREKCGDDALPPKPEILLNL